MRAGHGGTQGEARQGVRTTHAELTKDLERLKVKHQQEQEKKQVTSTMFTHQKEKLITELRVQ